LLTIRRVRDFFALLLSACSTVAVQKTSAEPHTGTSQKWHGVKQRQRI
jgi:hypothetical protein